MPKRYSDWEAKLIIKGFGFAQREFFIVVSLGGLWGVGENSPHG
jgi:hypothetical protein